MSSKGHSIRTIQILTGIAMLAGCGATYETDEHADTDGESEFGVAEQGLSGVCGGDDSNALSAALAVAIANELGRWDVNTDFQITAGKLELSTTGKLHCGTGCGNLTALLRLQDDASSVVGNHSPAGYRTKLTNWYTAQKAALDNLVVNTMLNVDKGVFRIKSVSSGKYVVPAAGSTAVGATIQQSDQYTGTTAAQWRVVLKGTVHQLVNVKSGLCMALTTNSNATQNMVQSTCSTTAFSQGFRFADMDTNVRAIRTAHLQAVEIGNASTANNGAVIQSPFSGSKLNQRFVFERVSGSTDLLAIATAVYRVTVGHTGMAIGVSSGSLSDGVSVVQQPYDATDDRFNWYLTPANSTSYQFINRRTGNCLDLQDPTSTTSKLVQRKCSTATSQTFFFTPTGEGAHVAWTSMGRTVDVPGGSTSSGAQLAEGGTSWQAYNKLTLTPVTAGEPHRLKFNRKAAGGPCGDYYWYDITQPNGVVLDDPASTFVQLIFAGGKPTRTGTDVNPFISQQVSGNQVAIDPAAYMNGTSGAASGSCLATDILYDATKQAAGQCCIKYTGVTGRLKVSAWSTTTFLCQ